MKKLVFIFIVMCLHSSIAAAQATEDTTLDHIARSILDDPGVSSFDPDATFEYLDNLNSSNNRGIHSLHANPDLSWIATHSLAREAAIHSDSDSHFSIRSRGIIATNVESQAGFLNKEYLGSSLAYYDRVRAVSPLLTIGLAQQKQAWEPNFVDRLNGFVQLRSPIQLTDAISIQQAVAGDYALAYGNGLLFGGGATVSKTADPLAAVEQRSFGVRSSLGSNLRGGAVQLGIGPASLTVFGASRYIDANIINDTIRTLYTTNYHRTSSEIALKNTVQTYTSGLRATISSADTSSPYLSAGATAFQFSYGLPYSGTLSAPFIGRAVSGAGLDLLVVSNVFSETSEIAITSNDTARRIAYSFEAVFEPSKFVGFSISHRAIPYNFSSPYGAVSGSAISTMEDLEGTFFGIRLTPIDHILSLRGYADIQDAILGLNSIFPRHEYDYFGSCTYTPITTLACALSLRTDHSEAIGIVQNGGIQTFATLYASKTNLRTELTYDLSPLLSSMTRYEHVSTQNGNVAESGYMVMERLSLKGKSSLPLLITSATRFATDSYASVLYAYESSVPGAGSIEVLDGAGWRFALRATSQILPRIMLSVAGAGFVYDSPRTIGSGLTERTGKTAFTFFAQLDFDL